MDKTKDSDTKNEKILLMVLPYMAPLCPPMGISCLKSALKKNGYHVKTVDVMAELSIREVGYLYLDTLKSFIPAEKRGFFFNVGIDVLKNHFMAYTNFRDEGKYYSLVKKIVYNNYYVHISDSQVYELNGVVEQLFSRLEAHLISLVEQETPTVLGVSVYRGTLAASLFACKIVKQHYPWIQIIMGGAIFSQELVPGTPNFDLFVKTASYIDKIVIGEGELLFLKYLKGELSPDKRVYTLGDIGSEMLNLDTADLPDFSDYDVSKYPILPTYTSRGCIYKCSFCTESSYWVRYRKKRASKIADELECLSKLYGRKLFLLTDCLINPVATDLSREMIRRNLQVYWDVYLKVDKHVCNPEYPLLWRKGGFYRARIGIETGSQQVLDLMDKKITVAQSKAAISSLASVGIKTTTYWAVGHPGETEEDFQKTLDFLTEMQDDIYEAEADPFRYFYAGQGSSDEWSEKYGCSLVYPAEATDMLLVQTWWPNTTPSREEAYDRLCRFKEHCEELGITNLDSVNVIHSSDERWKHLHKNAVPPFVELENMDVNVNEKDRVTTLLNVQKQHAEDVDFDF